MELYEKYLMTEGRGISPIIKADKLDRIGVTSKEIEDMTGLVKVKGKWMMRDTRNLGELKRELKRMKADVVRVNKISKKYDKLKLRYDVLVNTKNPTKAQNIEFTKVFDELYEKETEVNQMNPDVAFSKINRLMNDIHTLKMDIKSYTGFMTIPS